MSAIRILTYFFDLQKLKIRIESIYKVVKIPDYFLISDWLDNNNLDCVDDYYAASFLEQSNAHSETSCWNRRI